MQVVKYHDVKLNRNYREKKRLFNDANNSKQKCCISAIFSSVQCIGMNKYECDFLWGGMTANSNAHINAIDPFHVECRISEMKESLLPNTVFTHFWFVFTSIRFRLRLRYFQYVCTLYTVHALNCM